MEVRSTVRDVWSAFAKIGRHMVPKIVGSYLGARIGGFRGMVWGWRCLRVHPFAIFLVEPGATLELKGTLNIGFSLKQDVPLPGKRRTGLVVKKNGYFKSGSNVHLLVGSTVHVSEGARVTIGDRTFVNYDSAIIAREEITIGADCAISWGVNILDSNLHKIVGVPYSSPVHIGSHVWIGHHVAILQGTSIGSGAVIGAHSLVNADIPSNALAVGIPARVFKERVSWEL